MKKIVLAFGIAFLPFTLLCQNSFETCINSVNNEALFYSFETSYNRYVSVGTSNLQIENLEPYSPLIIEFDLFGEVTNFSKVEKADTSYSLQYGFEKTNGNFYFIGSMADSGEIYNRRIIYVCEMTPDLELVWEKFHPMPDEVRNELLIHFLTMPDNTILFEGKADTSQIYTNDFLFTGLLDLDGNLLDLHFQYDPFMKEFGTYSDFIFNFDTTAIYAFGIFAHGPYSSPVSFFEMDFDFNITNFTEYLDDQYLTAPTSVSWLPNGNLILADRENDYGGKTEGLLVKLLDPDFNFIRDTFMVRPGMVKIPVFHGLDYTDPNTIWIATFNAMGGFTPDEVFHIQVFDSYMNLKGVKVYGGEKKRYYFYNMLATSDGGCLLTGFVPACDTCENNNGYLFKVMPDEIVGIEDQSKEITRAVEVFPNPFHENLTVRTQKQRLFICIHDFTGKKVMESELQNTSINLNTHPLHKGIYFYKILDQGNVIQHGKLIKQ